MIYKLDDKIILRPFIVSSADSNYNVLSFDFDNFAVGEIVYIGLNALSEDLKKYRFCPTIGEKITYRIDDARYVNMGEDLILLKEAALGYVMDKIIISLRRPLFRLSTANSDITAYTHENEQGIITAIESKALSESMKQDPMCPKVGDKVVYDIADVSYFEEPVNYRACYTTSLTDSHSVIALRESDLHLVKIIKEKRKKEEDK